MVKYLRLLATVWLCLAGNWLVAGEARIALPQTPPAALKLTGLAESLSNKWALLEVQEYGQPAEHLALTEGSCRGTVTVVQVDARAGWAKVNYAGAVITLTVEKLSTAAALPAKPVGEHLPLPLLPQDGVGDP